MKVAGVREQQAGLAGERQYAAGTILADNDFNHYADHEGVDLLTALEAAKNILL